MAPRGHARSGSPYLAVQAQSHRLVLQRHEEGATIQLILQVEHDGIDWSRKLGSGWRGWGPCPSMAGPMEQHQEGSEGTSRHRAETHAEGEHCPIGLKQLLPPSSHKAQSHEQAPQDPMSLLSSAEPLFLSALTLTQISVPTLDGFAEGQLAPLHLQQQRDLLPGAWLILQQLQAAKGSSACGHHV